jgi:hypothetical protein
MVDSAPLTPAAALTVYSFPAFAARWSSRLSAGLPSPIPTKLQKGNLWARIQVRPPILPEVS